MQICCPLASRMRGGAAVDPLWCCCCLCALRLWLLFFKGRFSKWKNANLQLLFTSSQGNPSLAWSFLNSWSNNITDDHVLAWAKSPMWLTYLQYASWVVPLTKSPRLIRSAWILALAPIHWGKVTSSGFGLLPFVAFKNRVVLPSVASSLCSSS